MKLNQSLSYDKRKLNDISKEKPNNDCIEYIKGIILQNLIQLKS